MEVHIGSGHPLVRDTDAHNLFAGLDLPIMTPAPQLTTGGHASVAAKDIPPVDVAKAVPQEVKTRKSQKSKKSKSKRRQASSCCGYCPGHPGRLSALSVFHIKSVLYGVFVWAREVLNSQKRRFPARAVPLRGRARPRLDDPRAAVPL